MSNYNNLKTSVDANIKQNGNQEITGPILNSVLNQMVNILGAGYQFAGVATLDPATEPGTPDAKVFYIANGKGTYTNFGGIEVTEDEVVVLYYDTAWHKVSTGIATQAKLSELDLEISDLVKSYYTEEDGIALTDENGNVIWYLNPYLINEDGIYFVDDAGNIGIKIKDGKVDIGKIDSNLISIISNLVPGVVLDKTADGLVENYNKTYAEVKKLKDETESSINSLMKIKNPNADSKQLTITIPSASYDRKNVVLRVGLHWGNTIGGNTASARNSLPYNDVFFGGKCQKDFSDIRITDGDGNILKTRLQSYGNYEVIRDTNFPSDGYLHRDSSGRIYCKFGDTLKRTSDGGITWESVLDVTSYGDIVGIDSRNYLYLNKANKVYMSIPTSDNYTDVVEICDMNVLTPDGNADCESVTPTTGVVEDAQGYIYFGRYQEAYNPVIYRSINNTITPVDGAYCKMVYTQAYSSDANQRDQHIHHITIHKPTNTIYAGIDNARADYGAKVIKSIDNGNTWNEVNLNTELWNYQRGRDYLPFWISDDGTFSIGGGEVGVLGGYSLCKIYNEVSNNTIVESSIKGVLNTAHGNRGASSFGDDFIVSGMCARGGLNTTMNLMLSTDKGESWKNIYTEDDFNGEYPNAVGSGCRWYLDPFVPSGENEQCMFITGLNTPNHPLSALRVYKGGNHYYGEMFVNVGDIPSGATKQIIVESGYMMQSPEREIYSRIIKPIWSLPLNEGAGNIVVDSDGRKHTIEGNYTWDKQNTSVRFGASSPYQKDYTETSGLKLSTGAYINLGVIPSLTFNKGFSVILWYRLDALKQWWNRPLYNYVFPILNGGNGISIGFNKAGVYVGNKETFTRGELNTITFPCYVPIAIVVGNEDIPSVYVGRGAESFREQTIVKASSWNFSNLSETNLKIGTNESGSFINYDDVFITDINIYDKCLTRNDIVSIFKGYYI